MAILSMNRIAKAVILFIAQGAYSGKSPFVPGTAGTVVGVLLYLLLKGLPFVWYLVVCVLVTGIGVWAAGEAEKLLGKKDASSIVIDEIAGYLISMVLVPSGWMYVVAAFFLFRIFDIIKPFPLYRLQDLRGGLGVVLDDVGAGIYTNAFLQVVSCLIGRG
ncbi:MAG TPA: phosphatidylglycerophosphatase A [Nitrospirota bacterium]|nr:phosphatidylglycerophosphatase A [Nitrospirota bacterium]